MAKTDPIFSWIHLSDIHTGHGGNSHFADQRLVLSELRKDVRVFGSKRDRRPDAIFITGDIANSGGLLDQREYEYAQELIDDIASSTGVPKNAVFMVPGNHDVQRDKDRPLMQKSLMRDAREGRTMLDDCLIDTGAREYLLARQENYLAFSRQYADVEAGRLSNGTECPFYWRKTTTVAGRKPLTIRIVGLNTAIVAADEKIFESDKGRLRLGKQQLTSAFTNPAPDFNELVIVLTHHPLSQGWLYDESDAHRWVEAKAHIHLFGHIHGAESRETTRGHGGSLITIIAGPAHGSASETKHSYNWVELSEGDEKLQLCLWPRVFSQKSKAFRPDTDDPPDGLSFATYSIEHISTLPPSLPPDLPASPESPETLLCKYRDRIARSMAEATDIFGFCRAAIADYYEPLTLRHTAEKHEFVVDEWLPPELDGLSRILIESPAGSGKSTLIRFLAHAALKDGNTPIVIRLRRLRGGMALNDAVGGQIVSGDSTGWPPGILDEIMGNKTTVFFFDGLDELPEQERCRVVEEIIDFSRRAAGSWVIVTSRPLGPTQSIAPFTCFSIRPLANAQAYSLIHRLAKAAHSQHADDLQRELESVSNVGVQEFLGTPLLVALLFQSYIFNPSLPRTRTAFYQNVVDALYHGHGPEDGRFERPKKANLSKVEFSVLLARLAWTGCSPGQVEYSEIQLFREISRCALEEESIHVQPARMMDDLVKSVPLFYREGDTYGWVHRSMKDYFSAKFLLGLPAPACVEEMKRVYVGRRIPPFVNILQLLHSKKPALIRFTLLYWALLEYRAARSAPRLDREKSSIEHQVTAFGVCVYTKEFLDRVPPDDDDIHYPSEPSRSLAAHHKVISSTLTEHLVTSGGSQSSTYPVIATRYGKQSSLLPSLVFSVLGGKVGDIGSVLYPGAPGRKRSEHLLVTTRPEAMRLNTWYLSDGAVVGEEGEIIHTQTSAEINKYILMVTQLRTNLVEHEGALSLLGQIEAEISESPEFAPLCLQDARG